MGQEQLKKLAEWYGEIKNNMLYKDRLIIAHLHNCLDVTKIATYPIWQPHKDSNQLDMLGDKLWEDFNVEYMKIINTPTAFIADYYKKYKTYSLFKKSVPSERIISGRGKTKNEARLNAILNYIESK